MNTILIIAALFVAVTAYGIVLAIVAHVKTKDEIKLIEEKLREEEARKSAAETEEKLQATKAELASTLSTLTEEQLAAYNRTLVEMKRPIYQCYYGPYGIQTWRGW